MTVDGRTGLSAPLAIALIGVASCFSGNANLGATGGSDGGAGGRFDGGHVLQPGEDAGPTEPPSGLPCEITSLIGNRCIACHDGSAIAPSSVRLASYADLVAMSAGSPGLTVAQACAQRMRDDASPMPPAGYPRVAEADIAAFEAWIAGGSPQGDCGGLDAGAPDGPNPYDTPVTCSSGTNWLYGNWESPLMRPGGACIDCHAREGEGPIFAIAGTAYPSAHEPEDCNGSSAGGAAQVIITDAAGQVLTLTPNEAGNFYSSWRVSLTLPYTASVTFDGRERPMLAPQTNGDCNLCHTESGTMMAPGRVMLP